MEDGVQRIGSMRLYALFTGFMLLLPAGTLTAAEQQTSYAGSTLRPAQVQSVAYRRRNRRRRYVHRRVVVRKRPFGHSAAIVGGGAAGGAAVGALAGGGKGA